MAIWCAGVIPLGLNQTISYTSILTAITYGNRHSSLVLLLLD